MTPISNAVTYRREAGLDPAEFARVLNESGLGASRPTGDLGRLGRMLSQANLTVTARLAADGALLGVARGVTDFSWCCYLSELAVGRAAQGLGVGRGLVDQVRRELGPQVSLFLISMPDAVGFYERIGMARCDHAFAFTRER